MITPEREPSTASQLAQDLRSAAIDLPRGKIQHGINRLATRVEKGEPLNTAVNSVHLPSFVRQAILVSAQTGDLPLCLCEMARQKQAIRDLRSNIRIPVVYSGCHLLLFVAAAMLFSKFVAPEFERVLLDFDMALPSVTLAALWFATRGLPLLGWAALCTLVLIIGVRLLLGKVRWRLVLYALPGVGPLYRWMGTWQLLNLLKLLVERSVPLHEALATAADGVTDPNVAALSTSLSQRVTQGASFATELGSTSRLASSAAPLLQWGEQHHELPEALAQAADMLEGRMVMQSAWLRTVLPPIVTILIAALALGLGSAVWLPLISLIQNLS